MDVLFSLADADHGFSGGIGIGRRFTFGICFIVIAHFLFYALDENSKIEKLDLAKMFVFCLLAVLSKQAYIFLPLLYLMIPRRKFKSAAMYWIIFFALLAACFAGVGAWSYIVKPIYMPYRGDIDINPDEQISFILSNPLNFLKIAVANYIIRAPYYFVTFFGQLTWLDLFVPRWLTVFVFIILAGIALLDKNPAVNVSWRQSKAIFAAIIVSTALIVRAFCG